MPVYFRSYSFHSYYNVQMILRRNTILHNMKVFRTSSSQQVFRSCVGLQVAYYERRERECARYDALRVLRVLRRQSDRTAPSRQHAAPPCDYLHREPEHDQAILTISLCYSQFFKYLLLFDVFQYSMQFRVLSIMTKVSFKTLLQLAQNFFSFQRVLNYC